MSFTKDDDTKKSMTITKDSIRESRTTREIEVDSNERCCVIL